MQTERRRKGDIPRLFGTLFARCFLQHDNTVMLAGGGAMESKGRVGAAGRPMLRAIGLQVDVKSVLAGGHSVA